MHQYTLFVDESGQSGIKKIRTPSSPGASPYMTLAGVLVPNIEKQEILGVLAALAEEFKKPDLHCSRLNHNQIVRFATEVAKLRVLCFGLISRKATLGNYADDIKKDDKLFYNKNAQYLLERVGAFMEEKSLTEAQLSVVFEEGNFDYGKLKSLIRACRRDPKRRQSRTLRFVNPSFIYSKPKKEEPLLQLADLVAHALFRCVDDGPSTHGVMETRYLSEISGKFYAQEDSRKVLGHGIYPVHTLSAIKVTDKVADFLKKMNSN
ncbi:MAG TPA: hypothetical protein DEO85_01430 [Maritimibacter sp.]|nr:hypothetical protein [Maritimibacter sp.]